MSFVSRKTAGLACAALLALGCAEGGTSDPVIPDPPPPAPTTVGMTLFGTIRSQRGTPLASASVQPITLDPSCTTQIAGVTVVPEGYKRDLTYRFGLEAFGVDFTACLQLKVVYVYTNGNETPTSAQLGRLELTVPVNFTPSGAAPGAFGQQRDIVVP